MNKQIRRLAAGLLVCYLILFVQLNLLQVVKRTELADNPDNTRAILRDFDKARGKIVTADGVTIAESVPSAPGDSIKFQRQYPTNDLFANISGYYTQAYGATKVEKKYSDVLAGETGEQQLRALGTIFSNQDTTGSVQLTVRADLQLVAKTALGEREGSVVVLNPSTGAVLAMWSYPTFDPNLVVVHDNKKAGDVLTFLNAAPGKPTLANAYQERYMPGSTFKMITASVALENNVVDFDSMFTNDKTYTPPQTTNPIENFEGEICGGDLRTVFARSCNTAFAQTAVDVGVPKMVAGTQAWGIGEPIPFDLPGGTTSYFGDEAHFKDAIPKLAIQGFGEGDDLVVPLQMAMIAATIANGGVEMQPYVVGATLDHQGKVLDQTAPKVWKTPISPVTALKMTDLMIGVVQRGTAKCCLQLDNGIQAAAKTGTAQLNATGQPQRSHAWIAAFAPATAPQFAVAVILKGTNAEISSGTGGKLAGPIAKTILDYALAHPLG
ncbi:MAG: penicillin-binding protein [Ilumatobacteraceae bacterium]|nr:penicillin-binding protein [Ilumatobacteraceae bacterium]